jgi:hypothetical protein
MHYATDLFLIGGKNSDTRVAKETLTKVKMFNSWKFIQPIEVSNWAKAP